MSNKIQNTDEFVDKVFAELPLSPHSDDDHETCASNYARCSFCGDRAYWGNRMYHNRKHSANSYQWIEDPCDCGLSKQIKAAKQAISERIAVERLDELKMAAPHFVEKPTNFSYYNERVAALTPQVSEGEK